jgi:hypothetical protein
LKRQLRTSGMSSVLMKRAASSTNGWAVLHELLRIGESIALDEYDMVSSHVVNLEIGGGRELSV